MVLRGSSGTFIDSKSWGIWDIACIRLSFIFAAPSATSKYVRHTDGCENKESRRVGNRCYCVSSIFHNTYPCNERKVFGRVIRYYHFKQHASQPVQILLFIKSERQAYISAEVVGNGLFLLVTSTTAARFRKLDVLKRVADSFSAVPAPKSNLNRQKWLCNSGGDLKHFLSFNIERYLVTIMRLLYNYHHHYPNDRTVTEKGLLCSEYLLLSWKWLNL